MDLVNVTDGGDQGGAKDGRGEYCQQHGQRGEAVRAGRGCHRAEVDKL